MNRCTSGSLLRNRSDQSFPVFVGSLWWFLSSLVSQMMVDPVYFGCVSSVLGGAERIDCLQIDSQKWSEWSVDSRRIMTIRFVILLLCNHILHTRSVPLLEVLLWLPFALGVCGSVGLQKRNRLEERMGRETKSPWLEERMGRDTKSPWLDNLMSEWVEKQNPLDRRERLPLLSPFRFTCPMSEWVEKQNPLDRRERLPLLSPFRFTCPMSEWVEKQNPHWSEREAPPVEPFPIHLSELSNSFFRFAPSISSAFATQFCHSLIKRYTLLLSKVYYMSLFEFWTSPLFIEVHFQRRSGSLHHLFHLRRLESVLSFGCVQFVLPIRSSYQFYVGFANSATASSKGNLRSLAAKSTTLALFWVFEQPLCTSKSISKVILGVSMMMYNFEGWNRSFRDLHEKYFLIRKKYFSILVQNFV